MWKFGLVCLTLAVAMALGGVQAQDGSVKAIFEKYNLIGTFAADCGKPASPNNVYYVTRVIDANHVQRDIMEGPTSRARYAIVDKAEALGPNEVRDAGLLSGMLANTNHDRTPVGGVWRVEPNRIRFVEVTIGSQKTVTGGRFVRSNQETRWYNRCGGR